MKIERLRKDHVRDCVDCGEASLIAFLRQYARQLDERNLGRTYVVVDDPGVSVVGYYSLASGKIAFENLPETRKLPPEMPIPVVLLGRLAVDRQYQGVGLGGRLLLDALAQAVQVSRTLGIYAVEVEALNENARSFYMKYGFASLLDDPRHLFLAMKTVEALALDAPDG